MLNNPKIAVLVLAAGKSSRMKSIKQLEKVNNQTLLDITIEKIQVLLFDSIFCVLGANADRIRNEISSRDIIFIDNEDYENGLSSSIVSGLQYFKNHQLNFDSIFILLADQPAIEVSYLESMISISKEHKNNIIASNYGNKLGVPAIFPAIYFNDLLLIKGDKGAKAFINQRRTEVIHPKTPTNLIDIDTKEDLNDFRDLN
jgi:molybdenum cofactor cytidylyltransferase